MTKSTQRERTISSSPPGQNVRHFSDGIFKPIFLN